MPARSLPLEPDARLRARPIVWVLATRPAFLVVTLIAVLLGLALTIHQGAALRPWAALSTLVFALVAHAGANVINDYHDRDTDGLNRDRLYPFTGGSRFIQNEVLTARETAWLGYGALAMVVPAGLALTLTSGPLLVPIGLAGLLLGWAYSAPPLRLAGRGLGEVVITAAWLLVIVGTHYVQLGRLSPVPAFVGLPYALLVAAILYVNQFPDAKADAAAGKRTLVVRLGAARAAHGLPLLGLCAAGWHLGLMAAGAIPLATSAALLPLLALVPASAQLKRYASDPARLRPAIARTLAATVGYGAVLTFSLWVSA
ncbi:prenyltransferase [Tepidiphilus margaritifer]|uniref:prenyltransferase n=1 Tax=Tepidiphilus margaritifer TaxID=203471 RepID=UPI00040010C6|nr:prenyltransferase [Tepidiphilus margaritifer]